MKRTLALMTLMALSLLSACNNPSATTATPAVPATTTAPPQPSPTSLPVTEPTAVPPTTRLAVLTADNQVKFVDLLETVTNPNFPGGFLPRGGSAGTAVYYLDFNAPEGGAKRASLDGSQQALEFIHNNNYA